MVNYKIP